MGYGAEIRLISPPGLEDIHVSKKILCHRPYRDESPNLSLTLTKQKIILHEYGFGGSGWSLAPGASKKAVELLENYTKINTRNLK